MDYTPKETPHNAYAYQEIPHAKNYPQIHAATLKALHTYSLIKGKFLYTTPVLVYSCPIKRIFRKFVHLLELCPRITFIKIYQIIYIF